MNPLTNVRNIQKLNQTELQLGTVGKKSWHDQYKDSAWVFVGGLPYDLTEGDILCVFSQYGEIVNMNLVRDKQTGKSKGYGFICFEDQRSTVLTVDNLNSIKLLGRTIRVDHVEKYKVPKELEDEDDITKKLREEGCAPQIEPSSDDEEEEEEDDDLIIVPIKKPKKEKDPDKKSKKKKKDKKKIKREVSYSGSDVDDREQDHLSIKVKIEKRSPEHGQTSGSHGDSYDRKADRHHLADREADRHRQTDREADRHHQTDREANRDSRNRNGVDRSSDHPRDRSNDARRDREEFRQRGHNSDRHSDRDRRNQDHKQRRDHRR